MFTVRHQMFGDDERGRNHIVYAVRVLEGETWFLFFEDEAWIWVESKKYRPVNPTTDVHGEYEV